MVIYAIDNEKLMLDLLVDAIKEALPDEDPVAFTKPRQLLEKAKENTPDIVFLDVEMPLMDGRSLAEELKNISPNINLIFVTGYEKYSLDALKLYASGFILKPVDANEIVDAVNNLRFPVATKKILTIKAFGHFTVYQNENAVDFRLSKSKELFAFLVDRDGAAVSRKEVAAFIYEDDEFTRSSQNDISRAASWLYEDLEKIGAESVFKRANGKYWINTSLIKSDLHDFLNKEDNVTFTGEYMEQYSWGEYRKADLEKLQ